MPVPTPIKVIRNPRFCCSGTESPGLPQAAGPMKPRASRKHRHNSTWFNMTRHDTSNREKLGFFIFATTSKRGDAQVGQLGACAPSQRDRVPCRSGATVLPPVPRYFPHYSNTRLSTGVLACCLILLEQPRRAIGVGTRPAPWEYRPKGRGRLRYTHHCTLFILQNTVNCDGPFLGRLEGSRVPARPKRTPSLQTVSSRLTPVSCYFSPRKADQMMPYCRDAAIGCPAHRKHLRTR